MTRGERSKADKTRTTVAKAGDEIADVAKAKVAKSDRSRRAISKPKLADPQARRRDEELLGIVYAELRQIAKAALRRERGDHTLQPTALVHEAYLRLAAQRDVDWQGRTHFLAVSSQAMRRVLVDHARGKRRTKRGGGAVREAIDPDALALSVERPDDVLVVDELVDRLAKEDPRQAKILELRFFGGMTVAEVAEALRVSKRTVEAEWTILRAWLRREIERTGRSPSVDS